MKKFIQKTLLLNTIILLFFNLATAQDAPVFSQFTLNPFQFNPSYASQHGYAEANVFYRKQWLGIENAPEVGAFNIQAPVGRNVSLGFTALSNKTILLSTNEALGTFAYRVRFGDYHHLNFGISGGIAFNNFDLAAVADTNDPALANVVQKSLYAIGQFGFNYQFKNFNIGFALPNVLDSKPNSLKDFQQIKFDPFRNKFGSISYSFNLNDIQISPTVLYRALDSRQDQWEGMVMATYQGFLWLGASYRDGYGLTGFIGLKLKGRLRIGYAYEHPTSSLTKASNGTHEIYLGARLGKRDREEEFILSKKTSDSVSQVAQIKKAVEEQKVVAEEKKPTNQVVAKEEVKPIITEEPVVVAKTDVLKVEEKPADVPKVEEVPADYYVVLGAYRNQQNALKQMRDLRGRSRLPQLLYALEKNYYYVYTFKATDRLEALAELIKEREKGTFPDCWIYKAPKKK